VGDLHRLRAHRQRRQGLQAPAAPGARMSGVRPVVVVDAPAVALGRS
jgi:hypothetical protein